MYKEHEKLLEGIISLLSILMILGCLAADVWLLQYWLAKFGVDVGLSQITWKQSLAVILGIRLLVAGQYAAKKSQSCDTVETAGHAFGQCVRRAFVFAILWVL